MMPRIERNGICKTCGGKIRHYPSPPPPNAADVDRTGRPIQRWAHLDRADWIEDPHDAVPTDESLQKAGLA